MTEKHFPSDFLWGTATAAHQVEGDNVHSDWWAWEEKGGGAERSGKACNQYKLYEKDFSLARKYLNNNAHRLSLEWARLEPEVGHFDKREVEHYRDVLKTLKNLNMTIFVTLHHFTLPKWFADLGGFEKGSNISYFENYVKFCARKFGDLVDFWLTINEPNVYVLQAYLRGDWPPQKKNILSSVRVLLNLARSHQRAFEVIHRELESPQVGAALNYALFKSTPPNLINRVYCRILKFIGDDIFAYLTPNSHDFIGLNYYFYHEVSLTKTRLFLSSKEMEGILLDQRSDLGWKVYPKGIYDLSMELYHKFKKPIYITENGIADEKDSKRKKYIRDHLKWVHKAIKSGADVKGYFHWTLLDNFEWSFGFKPRFGLFEVDYKTFQRIPRKSASYYAEICRRNALEDM